MILWRGISWNKILKVILMPRLKDLPFLLLLFLIISCSNNNESPLPATQASVFENVYQIKEMNVQQIQKLDKAKTVVLIPGGILEEHGPYLPSFTDGYWNEKLADTLAKTIAQLNGWKALIFPTIPLGNSGANDIGMKYSFPGTYTVRFETLRSIFMDLAVELGEQGFKNVFIIHGHGAPNHNRAIDQAADFFNETYKGKMVNLMGLDPVMNTWFQSDKTKKEQAEDGFTVHAGMSETSSMLYLKPNLVDEGYKQATAFTGKDMESLVKIAKGTDWKGYFGSEKIASAAYGKKAWDANAKMYIQFVLDILNNKTSIDTIPRFADVIKQSKIDVVLDSLSLLQEQKRKVLQSTWLKRKKL